MAEEILGITWGLDGEELKPWQAAQRLYKAGFKDAKILATMWAIMESESGGFLKAWHHNVVRNEDGTILRSEDNLMEIKSTDLGFIQKNIVHSPHEIIPIDANQSQLFVDLLFNAFPELARGDESAIIAWNLYKFRGFQPWYAWSNGSYQKSLERGILATGNYLGMSLVNNSNLLKRVVS